MHLNLRKDSLLSHYSSIKGTGVYCILSVFLFPPPLPGRRCASLWTVLCGWNGGAHPSLRFQWRSASLRVQTQLEWQARSSQCFEGQTRREDQPVCLSQEPHTAENHARNETLRQRQDLKSCDPLTRTLFTFYFAPFPPISLYAFTISHRTVLSGSSLRPQFVRQSGCGTPRSCCRYGCFLCPPNSGRTRSRGGSHPRESWTSAMCLQEFMKQWPIMNLDQ